jgi:hypothetical protein
MSNDAIPFFEDGDELTCTVVGANVQGKHLVKISGNPQDDGTFSITPAGVGDKVLGVAMWDAVIGQRVTVHTIDSHHCMPIVTSGIIAANDSVKVAAGGTVVTAAGGDKSIGIALAGAASGADGMISLTRHTA